MLGRRLKIHMPVRHTASPETYQPERNLPYKTRQIRHLTKEGKSVSLPPASDIARKPHGGASFQNRHGEYNQKKRPTKSVETRKFGTHTR